jgi:hypothetical protein
MNFLNNLQAFLKGIILKNGNIRSKLGEICGRYGRQQTTIARRDTQDVLS